MRLYEYISQGGPIMYFLVIMNIVGIALIFWKFFEILKIKNENDNVISNVLGQLKTVSNETSDVKVTVAKDLISSELSKVEKGLSTIKIIASIAPLIGLLGTVVGILSAFRVIADKGLSDPSLFAGGISVALITTVGGLIVAIPHFVGYNYLSSLLDRIEIDIERKVIHSIFGGKS